MLKISSSFLEANRFIYNGVKDRVYNLGTNVLNYAVRHHYYVSVYAWSYLFIEVGRTAAEITFGETHVYNLDTCRDFLCNHYWNKSKEIDEIFYNPVTEFRCSEQGYSSYSFVECLQDLCRYMATIGESFYACTETLQLTESPDYNETIDQTIPEVKLSFPLIDYWDEICPKKKFRHPEKSTTKLKELAYLTECLETLCTPDNFIRFESSKEIISLCTTKNVMKLYELLHGMSNTIKKLQKASTEKDADKVGLITNVIVALSTVIGGAATIAAAIITYRTSRAAHILQNAIPSLDEGVRTISRAAAETSRAIIRGNSVVEGMMSAETLKTLKDLSHSLSGSSSSPSSFYSAPDNSPRPEIRVRFEPSINVINVVKGTVGVGTGGVVGVIGGSKGGGGGGGQGGQLELDQTVEKLTSLAFNTKDFLPNYESTTLGSTTLGSTTLGSTTLDMPIFNIRDSWWFSYLKNTLPTWNNAYCYYEGVEKHLFCKLPRPPFDKYISFFLQDLKDFFSKNTAVLCTTLNEELWCNWSSFLDLISSTRNITIHPDCDWDHFGLQIDRVSSDTYSFQASGTCYNDTGLLKV